jgi:uncharacterized protein YbjQ (UPF0145 family)
MFDSDRLGLAAGLKYLGRARNMIVSNMEELPGQRVVRHLGVVQGSTVKAKNVFRDIGASLKNLVGGELKSYTDLINESRQEAVERMKQEAEALGANAILNVRFSTSTITQGAAELLAYGTAVIVEDHADG